MLLKVLFSEEYMKYFERRTTVNCLGCLLCYII